MLSTSSADMFLTGGATSCSLVPSSRVNQTKRVPKGLDPSSWHDLLRQDRPLSKYRRRYDIMPVANRQTLLLDTCEIGDTSPMTPRNMARLSVRIATM